MKIISKILILLTIFISISNITIFAFEDEIFKFDVPDNYMNMSYQGMYFFADTENTDRGMIIQVENDFGLKKSVWSISDSDLNEIINAYGGAKEVVTVERRAKLGKEQTIKIIMYDEVYMELNILASNKYVYVVIFTGNSLSDLVNEDYKMIKNSFKIKDATTNPIPIYILIAVGVIAIKFFLSTSPSDEMNEHYRNYRKNKKIDYKNMTEEELNNFRHK